MDASRFQREDWVTRFRSLEIFQRIIHLSPIIYIYISPPFVCQNSLSPPLFRQIRSKIDIVSFEEEYLTEWKSSPAVTSIERRIYTYTHTYIRNCTNVNDLFCSKKAASEFSLSLFLSFLFVRRQSCERSTRSKKKFIHGHTIRFDSMQRIYPVVTTDHNSSSNYPPLLVLCVCIYIYRTIFSMGEERRERRNSSSQSVPPIWQWGNYSSDDDLSCWWQSW